MKYMSTQITKFTGYFVVCVMCIFVYGRYRCNHPEYTDILETKLVVNQPLGLDLDGWSMSHFLFFTLIGYTFPTKNFLLCAFLLGCGWEIFENTAGKDRPSWLGGYGDCEWENTDQGNWWYGKISDPIINMAGLYCGYRLSLR